MRGTENDHSIECRYEMFKDLWQPQEEAIAV